jgi:hypothetical protein
LLNERVDNVNVDSLSEKKLFNIYFNLFKTNLTESIPIEKLETWLNYLFSLFETKETNILELSNEIFEKLIKKSVRQMLIHDSLNCLQTFVNKVRVKNYLFL